MRAPGPRLPLPTLVVLLGVTSLLTDVSSEMILPLLPGLVLGTLGGTPLIVGLVDGVADALSSVLKLWSGRLSDRAARRKPFALAGYALSTAARPLVALATAPWHVVAIRAVDRVGKGLRSAPRDALIADAVAKKDAPRAFAFHRAMDHTGAVLGPLLASALLAAGLDERRAILCAWVPGVLAVLALSLVREPPRTPTTHEGSVEARAPVAPSVTPTGAAAARPFLVVMGLFAVAVLADSFVLVRAHDLGLSAPWWPLLWSALHVAKVVAATTVAKVQRAADHPAGLPLSWCLVAAGTGLLVVERPEALWAGAVVLGVGHGLREPLEKARVRALASAHAAGDAFGRFHLVTGLAALPAGLWVGALWTAAHGRLALAVSAGLVVVAAAAVAWIDRR
jgi:hypothetical protein